MMPNRILLLIVLGGTIDLAVASEKLKVVEKAGQGATIYGLQLTGGAEGMEIWTRKVDLVGGKKPFEWCSLTTFTADEKGILALMNYNDFHGVLLQFSPSGELLAKVDTNWFSKHKGGEGVELMTPDKVSVTDDGGGKEVFTIRDGKLYDTQNNLYQGRKMILGGVKDVQSYREAQVKLPPLPK